MSKLDAIKEKASERLQAIQKEATEKFMERIYKEAEAAAAQGKNNFTLPINFFAYFVNAEGNNDEIKAGMAKPIKMMEAEGFTCALRWVHPDCSYCEDCGPKCKPTSIVISF